MTDTPSPTVIETTKLTKVFNDFWGRPRVRALDGVSLSIREGEVFGLLGPNGSGKTTSIKILLGLLYPTQGRVVVLGRSPRDVQTKARIGYLPEESYLYPFLNAEETLDFYGRLFHLDRNERRKRTEQLLDLVGLSVERRRPVREYSKGMARRIGIAQALINDPELVVLDEPTSGLDPIGNREVKDLILRLKQRGKTILLCSHLLADVEDVCDRIAILYGGKLRQEGTVDELLTRSQVTQISAEHLQDRTVAKVLDTIRAEEGNKQVNVGHPTTRLETFFLQVVQEAQQEETETAGARMGLPVETFLTAGTEPPPPSPADVLAGLVRPPEEAGGATPASRETESAESAPGAEAPADREKLSGLTGPGPVSDGPQSSPAGEAESREPEVQRSVLDGLVKPAGDAESDTEERENKK